MIPGSANPLLLASAAAAGPVQIERSLRFNSSDSGFLSRTPAVAGNRRTWTWAGWVKRSAIGSGTRTLFDATLSGGGTENPLIIGESVDDTLSLYLYNGSSYVWQLRTTQVFRDPSAWYHVLVAVDTTQSTASDRIKFFINGTQVTTFAVSTYPSLNADTYINNNTAHAIGSKGAGVSSLYSGYLADIHFIDGQALTPSSFTEVSATTGQLIPLAYSGSFGTNGFWLKFSDNSAATAAALGNDYSGNNNDWTPNNFSVTQGTGSYTTNTTGTFAANRGAIKAFDGATSGSDFYAQPADGNTVTIGSLGITGITQLRMWLGKNNSGDPWGTLTLNATNVTSFLTTNYPSLTSTGQWIDLTSQLPGSTLSTITMTSPVANTDVRLSAVEVNGIVLIDRAASTTAGNDSLVDTPTSIPATDTGVGGEVRGNYATWNPLQSSAATLTNGNLDCTTATATGGQVRATIAVSSGKWYWEVTVNTTVTANNIGIVKTSQALAADDPSYLAGGYSYYGSTGDKRNNASASAYGATYGSGDVIGVALDLDAGTLVFYKNGASQGTAFSSLTGEFIPCVGDGTGSNGLDMTTNFGQRAFAYPLSGFKALCDTNLGAPVVAKPNTLMDVVKYDGNGSTQTISGLAFSPDLIWTKSRSQAYSHNLYDSVRGIHKNLFPNETSAENTDTNTIQAFNSDGFQIGSNDNGNYTNGGSAVAWTWDAGGTTDPSNTAGSITSQVRANVSAGFSVVTFNSGNSDGEFSVGHGLGVAPRLIIMKSRTRSGGPWWVHHLSATDTTTKYLQLSTTSAVIDNGGSGSIWGAALPTSTVFGFSVGAGRAHTQNEDIVSYAFAPVVGYSSMGSYVGNGSADGPFVYTGHRSRFLLIKRTDSAENWFISDTARSGYNVSDTCLFPALSNAESSSNSNLAVDFLSNGFKLRSPGSTISNASGGTYIYYAVAENPFQYARAR